jgi:hypothetical protein
VILVLFESRLGVSYRTPLTGCARDNGTGGASGVFRWADRIGIPVRLLEDPIWEGAGSLPSPSGHCILTMGNGSWSPTGDELEPEDWQHTRDWLSRGNTLIIVTTAHESLPRVIRRDLMPWTPVVTRPETLPLFVQASVESRLETSQASVTSGGTLSVDSKGPRLSAPPRQLPARGDSGPRRSRQAEDVDPRRWQLAGDERGGVFFRVPVGRGAVYVLLDDFAWTNAGLDHGDNARVLAGVLGREIAGGALAFDEYRHGHGRAESFLTYLLNLPGSSAVMWLAAIWALLYVYGRNVRLTPVEAYVEKERRTAQEYIDAVAQLYERARAAPLVVAAVARRLRQVSRSRAERPPAVDELLRTAEIQIRAAQRPAAPVAAIELVAELIQLRKRMYGTRKAS